MPTRGRQDYALLALEAYRAQEWPDKDLIVIDDADDPSFPEGIDAPDVIYNRMAHRLTIGAKRNIAISRSTGDVIAHFDSDDWSAPERLTDQITRLGDLDLTGYNSMRFLHGAEWWEYTGAPNYAIGTSLLYRREYWERSPFPCEMIGEDSHFIVPAQRSGRLAVADAGIMMYATIHAGNTSPRALIENKQWRRIEC